MISSKSIEKKECENYDFPFLGVYAFDNSFVVLFTSWGSGTVVYSTYDGYKVGEHANGWGMSEFVPYNGSIMLKNS